MSSGKSDELKGRVKEAAGALIGDKKLKMRSPEPRIQVDPGMALKMEARRMKPLRICVVASVAMLSLTALTEPAWGGSTKCTMKYSLAGWSAGYSTASGSGTISCGNGQSARVSLRAKGGGVTAGMSNVINGSGTFSEVGDIGELLLLRTSMPGSAGCRLRRWRPRVPFPWRSLAPGRRSTSA
jgi:hypothetical protein